MDQFFVRMLACVLFLALGSCGAQREGADSKLALTVGDAACFTLRSILDDKKVANKGWGTLTITHPDIISNFSFSKMLGKFRQVSSVADRQEMVRVLIRSFLVKKVSGIQQEQPLRPFVIPELFCPLLDSSQVKRVTFCGSLFSSNQTAAITEAITFLDSHESLGNFANIDKLLTPLALITIPERLDLPADEQTLELRIIYGLRDATGKQVKPATVIMEFASPRNGTFYDNLAVLQNQYKDRNDPASLKEWAGFLESNMDCYSFGGCQPGGNWRINQIRINELAFRGNDVLWDFREYRFPALDSSIGEFGQVPVAFTPWVDFADKDRDPALMNKDFEAFLKGKGLSSGSLNVDQSIDIFEEFMAQKNVLVSNSQSLEPFFGSHLQNLTSLNPGKFNRAYPFHLESQFKSPAALARPGMQFFLKDNVFWTATFKQTCQGCHVATSSIARSEATDTMQGFYQVSPRVQPSGAEKGLAVAGSNVLSVHVLRETELRTRSLAVTLGCISRSRSSQLDEPVRDGHSLTNPSSSILVPTQP